MNKNIAEKLYMITSCHSHEIENRGDLGIHAKDDENTSESSVTAIEAMLMEAYELGWKAAEAEQKQKADFKSEIFRNAYKAYGRMHPKAR